MHYSLSANDPTEGRGQSPPPPMSSSEHYWTYKHSMSTRTISTSLTCCVCINPRRTSTFLTGFTRKERIDCNGWGFTISSANRNSHAAAYKPPHRRQRTTHKVYTVYRTSTTALVYCIDLRVYIPSRCLCKIVLIELYN